MSADHRHIVSFRGEAWVNDEGDIEVDGDWLCEHPDCGSGDAYSRDGLLVDIEDHLENPDSAE